MKAALFIVMGCLSLSPRSVADIGSAASGDRIAAHFEASSSRLRGDDIRALEGFVQRAEGIAGAKLSVLIPDAVEPARTRFVAARVAELERRVPALSDIAEFQRSAGAGRGDVLWLTISVPEPESAPQPVSLDLAPVPSPAPAVVSGPVVQPPVTKPMVMAGDLQLTDWVVRGVKHPAEGPAYAYVARADSSAAPHEVVEAQTDKDLGLIKEIRLSPDGFWVVRTEIGWIRQVAP